MNILIGINRFLNLINNNWTSIVVMIGLALGIYRKVRAFLSHSTEEKIAIAKAQIRQGLLSKIADAELDFADWNKAGSIKRSQVIEQIYAEYPILSKIAHQDELIAWVDNEIDNSLDTLKDIIKSNEEPVVNE